MIVKAKNGLFFIMPRLEGPTMKTLFLTGIIRFLNSVMRVGEVILSKSAYNFTLIINNEIFGDNDTLKPDIEGDWYILFVNILSPNGPGILNQLNVKGRGYETSHFTLLLFDAGF